jgi:hypothetical protein
MVKSRQKFLVNNEIRIYHAAPVIVLHQFLLVSKKLDKILSGPNFVVLGPKDFPIRVPSLLFRVPIFHISGPKIAALGPSQQVRKFY